MKYVILKVTLASPAYQDEKGSFFQDVTILVDLENTKFPNPISDGATIDITNKVIDEKIMIYINEESQKHIDQKYNS